MINTSQLTDILRDAISDYAAHAEEKTPAEWLQGYLGEKLPDKSVDAIHAISSEILGTLDLMEQKKAAFNAAIEIGESAESWFAKEAMKESSGNGETARAAAEFLNGITFAKNSYGNAIESEIIDIDGEVWTDDEWNDYRLKDSLKEVAVEAGKAGMREIASEVFLKASEEGIAAVFEDSDFVQRSLEKGAVTGLKVAVSAGLAVAEDSGVIPPSTFDVIAATAHRTVESLAAFGDVIRGRKTMTEAIIEVKNTAVSTFSAMWKKRKTGVLHEIKEAVTSVFGMKGAVVSGLVTGIVTPAQKGNKLLHVLKETGKAVWGFLTKERHIPILSKLKKKLFG
ncbi:MAG: hypothetical protein PUB97_07425 [Ruminococcus sp.]|nr:hypothetical protein [Ruminococcus sp.]